MKKIILYEVLKLGHWRSAWKILFFMMAANALLLNYQMTENITRGYSLEEKSACYRKMENLSEKEKMEWIGEQTDQGTWDGTMLMHVYDEIEAAASYDDYLSRISEQAEQIKNSMLTEGKYTYEYRNAEAVVKKYENLRGLKVKAQFSDGILAVTENPFTDFLILISLLVLIVYMIAGEYEGGYLQYTKIMARGKTSYMTAKAIVSLALGVIVTLFFYISGETVAVLRLQQPKYDAAIQSISGYAGCPYQISVIQYLALFLIGKIVVICCISAVFFLVCICCKSYILSCTVFSLIGIAEYLLWKKVHKFSVYRIWKDYNVFSFLQTDRYFKTYETWDFLEHPVSAAVICVLICVLVAGIAVSAAVYVFAVQKEGNTRHILKISKFRKKSKSGYHLFRQEAYKLYVINYGILVLALVLLAEVAQCSQIRYWVDEEEFYYQEYSQILKGKPNGEKKQYIIEETQKQNNIKAKEEQYNKQYKEGVLSESEWLYLCGKMIVLPAKQNAFKRAKDNFQRISVLYDEGFNVEYLPQTGWERLFGDTGIKNDYYTYAFLVIVFTFVFGNYYCMEYESGMQTFLSLNRQGGIARKMKYLNSVIFAGMTGTAAFYPDKQVMLQRYGLQLENVSIKSIAVLDKLPLNISIPVWLYSREMFFIGAGVASAFLIVFLSEKVKNKYAVILISLVLFLMPVWIRISII